MKKFYVDFPESHMVKLRLLAGLEGKTVSSFVREKIVALLNENAPLIESLENLKNGVIDNGRNE